MDEPPIRRGVYFFLSYAHSPPFAGGLRSDADPSVGIFFRDLTQAVGLRARPATEMRIGFFDQLIPPGEDLKARLHEALSSAEVFVPLYSPGYFSKSWPLREQEVFRRRLSPFGPAATDQHIVPVLWTPLPSWEQPQAMTGPRVQVGSEYDDNGLRALCMLAPYREAYKQVLASLAHEIVQVVERSPLGPSPAPELDTIDLPAPPDARFLVAMLAAGTDQPALAERPDVWWRPVDGRRVPPVVQHAGNIAERLGLTTLIGDFDELQGSFERAPGIVLVDPWAVTSHGPEQLGSMIAGLPDWITLLVLDPCLKHAGSTPIDQAVAVLASVRPAPVNRVPSMGALEGMLPDLMARARRTYLRAGRVFPPAETSRRPPRLRAGPAENQWEGGTGE